MSFFSFCLSLLCYFTFLLFTMSLDLEDREEYWEHTVKDSFLHGLETKELLFPFSLQASFRTLCYKARGGFLTELFLSKLGVGLKSSSSLGSSLYNWKTPRWVGTFRKNLHCLTPVVSEVCDRLITVKNRQRKEAKSLMVLLLFTKSWFLYRVLICIYECIS